MEQLAGCWAKLDRAKEHQNELQEEGQRFLADASFQVDVDVDPKSGWHEVRLVRVPSVPLRLCVIVGDLVHNLRSALDHLVWQLVLLEGRTPGGHNRFPIYKDVDVFHDRVTLPARRTQRGPLGGITVA